LTICPVCGEEMSKVQEDPGRDRKARDALSPRNILSALPVIGWLLKRFLAYSSKGGK